MKNCSSYFFSAISSSDRLYIPIRKLVTLLKFIYTTKKVEDFYLLF